MKFRNSLLPALAAGLALAATPLRAEPADKAEVEALRAEVQQLAAEVKTLTAKLAQKEAAEKAAVASAPTAPISAPAASPAPKISASEKGVSIASADGANVLRFHGLAQLDSRLFFGDRGVTNNAFVLRRARFFLDGTFAKNYAYQLVPDFAGSAATILDANFTITVDPALQVKFGKFKVPTGLERLQSDSFTFFDERSLASDLTPDRDLGVQASGDVFGGKLNYAAGVFGGVPDSGASNNTDFDNEKDVAARLFASPFKADAASAFRGLSFGVGATTGRQKTTAGRASAYKTDGQQTFFAYNSGVVADGRVWRVIPQLDYRTGPFGLMAEYIVSTVNVRSSATAAKTELRNRAWEVSAGYVLTGEDSSYSGVVPRDTFDWAAGTWGAFELTGRISGLRIDDAAFPTLASAAANADQAKAIGLGLNWYLSRVVRFTFDYYQTQFGFNRLAPAVPTAPVLRQDEKALVSRFQLSF